jgi:hypothetical protein
MVTSVALHNAVWMDGVQVNANDVRLQTVAGMLTGASPSGATGIAARPGVRYGTGNPMQVGASSGMSVTVNAGVAFVQGSTSATAGMYTGCLDTTTTLTATTSDPTNPRIDNVIVQFVDVGTSSSTGTVNIQAGTPAASPVAPTLPANSLLLAQIAVGAGVSTITSGNITDKRVFTVAQGGILPMANVSGGISGPAGLYAHDLSSGRLKVSDGSGNARAPKTGAFTPVSTLGAATVTAVLNSFTPIVSVNVTTDGATEVEVYAAWLAITPTGSASVGDYAEMAMYLDGSPIPPGSAYIYRADSTSTNPGDLGSIRLWITPSAGTHNIGLSAASLGHTFALSYPSIRVGPSFS